MENLNSILHFASAKFEAILQILTSTGGEPSSLLQGCPTDVNQWVILLAKKREPFSDKIIVLG